MSMELGELMNQVKTFLFGKLAQRMHVQGFSGFSGLAFKILELDNTFIWQIRTFWDGTDFSVKS